MTSVDSFPSAVNFLNSRAPLTHDEPTTLPEVYLRVAHDHPKRDTLNYKRDGIWHSISAGEMLRHARQIALGLRALGVRKGDRVAIISESCIEWVLADQGCLFAGAITVPIYPTLTSPQVEYILKDCEPRVLFVSSAGKLSEIEQAVRARASITHSVLFNPSDGSGQLTLTQLERLGALLEVNEPNIGEQTTREVHANDLATIIYTSGTTGEPKGVMLTHSNMVSNLIDSSNHLDFGEEDAALSALPLSHVFERQAMNMYLHHGMSVYFGELDTLGEYLREVRPTVFVGVPRIYEKILARVQDRATAKGRLNASLVRWSRMAVSSSRRFGRVIFGSSRSTSCASPSSCLATTLRKVRSKSPTPAPFSESMSG